MLSNHLIGKYEGREAGPLLLCIAGMHGNEPAGVEALKTVFQLLEREPLINPGFRYRGSTLGLLGNSRAYEQGKRFIVKDLNRQWTKKNTCRIQQSLPEQLDSEDLEIRELLALIEAEIKAKQPEQIILLDLHTTSASGGIFSIATDESESRRIAVELHAPVITGLLRGIAGTTLHYFSEHIFPCPTTAVAFEAGQHEDPLSIHRSIAAIINCMRSIGSVRPEDVENRHDELLLEYSRSLPKITELIQVHSIAPADEFRMRPGYSNFQTIVRDEVLAEDRHGLIRSPQDGLILMPLYQPQGSDGFFVVREI